MDDVLDELAAVGFQPPHLRPVVTPLSVMEVLLHRFSPSWGFT
ncbi:hypothetical protein [Corynebacterium atypicum]|nr:hypothetical protein [Corynebacterium atypicum]